MDKTVLYPKGGDDSNSYTVSLIIIYSKGLDSKFVDPCKRWLWWN